MITYLKVRNLAIVEEFAVEPSAGLNVLTGETGAGKSLLIDSLEFLSGARSSSEMIRTGEDKMSAEAIVHAGRTIVPLLDELGIDASGDHEVELIVRRELSASGRGRVLVNGSPVTVRDLQRLMDRLIDIHGQNESHDRLAGQSFRELLDEFAQADEALNRTRVAYAAWREAFEAADELSRADRDRNLRIDLLKYQIDEIDAAKLQDGEEESLREEKAILANAKEMIEATSTAFSLLEDDESSALAQIARAQQAIQTLARSIAELGTIAGELEDVRYRLADSARSIGRLAETVRIDPDRLDEIEERLVTIERLKKKYGGTIPAVLQHAEASREEFDRLSDFDSALAKLRAKEHEAFTAYRSAADDLSKRRRAAAKKLETAVQSELTDLAMEGTSIRIVTGTSALASSPLEIGGEAVAFGPDGYDRIDFLVSPNRGEELRPLQKIASGGELSRLQLALAAALFSNADRESGVTLVFDEIDAGIGGRVAEVVGRKLRELSRNNQVLCVTHLAQIASLGVSHFRVWKEAAGDRTRARIARLDGREERVGEIARMIGGEKISDSARAHASELLQQAAAEPARKRKTAATVR